MIGTVKLVALGGAIKTKTITTTVARTVTAPGGTTQSVLTQTLTAPGGATTVAGANACSSRVAYPGDGATREAIAQWMARAARARRVPGELPVMAALETSGHRNLSGGDRDDAGYFGMRVSIWNNGKYAGFPTNRELQLNWFIDQALTIWAPGGGRRSDVRERPSEVRRVGRRRRATGGAVSRSLSAATRRGARVARSKLQRDRLAPEHSLDGEHEVEPALCFVKTGSFSGL